MTDDPNHSCLFKWIEQQENTAYEFGFYWESIKQLLEQIQSECAEVQDAWQKNDRAHLQEEIGDLIQAAVSLAVFCRLDPRETLLMSIKKFEQRYLTLVRLARQDGFLNLKDKPTEILLSYWDRAKQYEDKNLLNPG